MVGVAGNERVGGVCPCKLEEHTSTTAHMDGSKR